MPTRLGKNHAYHNYCCTGTVLFMAIARSTRRLTVPSAHHMLVLPASPAAYGVAILPLPYRTGGPWRTEMTKGASTLIWRC